MTRLRLLFCFLFQSVLSLNIYVNQYEKLDYNPVSSNRRLKRSTTIESPIKVSFSSFGRDFHLLLRPIDEDTGLFHHSHSVDVDEQNVDDVKPHEFLFEGIVSGDRGSRVYGSILDGLFDGHIHLSNGRSFTVEKARKYVQNPVKFHSIIYPDEAITHKRMRRKRSATGDDSSQMNCGLDVSVHKNMEQIQKSAQSNETDANNVFEDEELLDSFPERYTGIRSKRQLFNNRRTLTTETVNGRRLFTVRTCSLYVQADHKLFEHIRKKEGNGDPIRTREEIMGLFYNHIKAVNQIYESTNFGGVNGLNFVIQRTSIFTPDSCTRGRALSNSSNPFCQENVDVSNYLNMNSQRNHSSFCLAYALTYRDFVGGTLGLAWVASPNTNTAGGVCQIYQKYNEGTRGWVHRSLNTGIITLVNYGNRVPTRVSQLTLAHEIGHNFGSPHDYPLQCQPGLPDGNFIMFASATSGDKHNNAKFSPCSIRNITSVLYEVLRQTPVDPQKHLNSGSHGKRNCFQSRKSAFCGNQIYEPTSGSNSERCDCGFTDKDCTLMGDSCCMPPEVNGITQKRACRLIGNARCSPSNGQCCNNQTCNFYPTSRRKLCRQSSDCQFEQFCNGLQAQCPESRPKKDGIACQDSTKVCQAGSCNGSICQSFGFNDCFLTEGTPEQLCHLACEKNGECQSTFDMDEFDPSLHGLRFIQSGREKAKGLLLRPGSPCNNYQGYCDIYRKCRSVDSNGPLARLRNLLFNKETINSVSDWVQEHWWAVVFMGIGLALLLALFVKCCAVHTPSTNPNKAPAQSIYETLRRPQTLIRRRHHRSPENRANQHHSSDRHRRRHHRSRSGADTHTNSAATTTTPVTETAAAGANGVAQPNIIVVEPPPPYSVADTAAGNMPRRGHRKNRKKASEMEMRSQNGRHP